MLGHFIDAFHFAAFLLLAVLAGLLVAEVLQHAQVAVGLGEDLAAALDLALHCFPLADDLQPLRSSVIS